MSAIEKIKQYLSTALLRRDQCLICASILRINSDKWKEAVEALELEGEYKVVQNCIFIRVNR